MLGKKIRLFWLIVTVIGAGCVRIAASEFLPETGHYIRTDRLANPIGESTPPQVSHMWVVQDDRACVAGLVDVEPPSQTVAHETGDSSCTTACGEVFRGVRRAAWLQIDKKSGALFEEGADTPSLPAFPRVGDEWITAEQGGCAAITRITAASVQTVRTLISLRCGETEKVSYTEEWTQGRGRTRIEGGRDSSVIEFVGSIAVSRTFGRVADGGPAEPSQKLGGPLGRTDAGVRACSGAVFIDRSDGTYMMVSPGHDVPCQPVTDGGPDPAAIKRLMESP